MTISGLATGAGLTIALIGGSTLAAENDILDACRREPDAAARLACYDRLAPPILPPGTEATPLPEASPQVNTDPAALNDVLIVEHAVTASGRSRFRLENGQVWEQVEPARTALETGHRIDTVQTLFGAWRMRDHAGEVRGFKVRRIE